MSSPSAGSAEPVAVSVGGSLIGRGPAASDFLSALADLLRRLGRSRPLVVTTGGGTSAREYIDLGRALGFTEVELDEIGIEITRIHARLLAGRIGPPTPAHPPRTVAAAVAELRHASPVVLGGTEPGHTTDGVAALLAVRLRAARLVNATSVAGLFDRDPTKDRSARRLDRLGHAEFLETVRASTSGAAGQNFVFDRLGADLLKRATIPLAIVDGRDLANLEAAIDGRPFDGTLVGGAARAQR